MARHVRGNLPARPVTNERLESVTHQPTTPPASSPGARVCHPDAPAPRDQCSSPSGRVQTDSVPGKLLVRIEPTTASVQRTTTEPRAPMPMKGDAADRCVDPGRDWLQRRARGHPCWPPK